MDLVIMLYDGCVKQLRISKIHIEDENFEPFMESIEKAEEIVLELIRSLNFKVEMANDLLSLYEFWLNEMVEVSVSKEAAKLDPVIDMLLSLREAWAEAKIKAGNTSNYTLSE